MNITIQNGEVISVHFHVNLYSYRKYLDKILILILYQRLMGELYFYILKGSYNDGWYTELLGFWTEKVKKTQ